MARRELGGEIRGKSKEGGRGAEALEPDSHWLEGNRRAPIVKGKGPCHLLAFPLASFLFDWQVVMEYIAGGIFFYRGRPVEFCCINKGSCSRVLKLFCMQSALVDY